MRTFYIDSLFILNFIVDYLLLFAAGKICALPLRRWRMAAAAALGGAYAVGAVIFPSALALSVVKILIGAGMVLAAFGWDSRYPRAAISFFAVSAAFGGAVYAISGLGGAPLGAGAYIAVNLRMLLVSFALCYAAVSLAFRFSGRQRRGALHKVTLKLGGKSAQLTALEDTGNELLDPVSGESVMVVWAAALGDLLPPHGVQLLCGDPVRAYEELSKLPTFAAKIRLVPFSSIGGSSVMLCLRPDALTVDGKTSRALVGISRMRLSGDGKYDAII